MAYKRLSIPDPCHQQWDRMKPSAEGRHCSSCNTVVKDFTQLTDEELIAAIQSGKHHCGNFYAEQLDEWYYVQEQKKERKKYWSALVAAMVAGVLQISSGFSQNTHTHKLIGRNTTIERSNSTNRDVPVQDKEEIKTTPTKITLSFLDHKERIPPSYVRISDVDENILGNCGKENSWTLEVPDSLVKQGKIKLVIYTRYYYKKTIVVTIQPGKTVNRELLLNKKPKRLLKRMRGKYIFIGTPSF